MIQKFLLHTQMIWMIFIKILKDRIQIKNILIVFDNVIVDMLSNEKLNPIVTYLFIRGRKSNIQISLFLLNSLISMFQKILN